MDTNEKNIPQSPPEETAEKKVRKPEDRIDLPPLLTVSPSPHIKSPEKISTIMLDVLIALIPAFVWGAYVFGMRAVAIAFISVIS